MFITFIILIVVAACAFVLSHTYDKQLTAAIADVEAKAEANLARVRAAAADAPAATPATTPVVGPVAPDQSITVHVSTPAVSSQPTFGPN